MGNSKSRRIRKARVPQEHRIAAAIGVPAQQVANDRFEPCDVVNHTAEDHRAMVRSMGGADKLNEDARRTIRRKPKLDTLPIIKLLTDDERKACQWYRDAHSLRYDTQGITANYGGTSGRSTTNFDHLPKTTQQLEAYMTFDFARAGIDRSKLWLFESVVLYDRPVERLRITFRQAARQLLERIAGKVQL